MAGGRGLVGSNRRALQGEGRAGEGQERVALQHGGGAPGRALMHQRLCSQQRAAPATLKRLPGWAGDRGVAASPCHLHQPPGPGARHYGWKGSPAGQPPHPALQRPPAPAPPAGAGTSRGTPTWHSRRSTARSAPGRMTHHPGAREPSTIRPSTPGFGPPIMHEPLPATQHSSTWA